ncbi:MAG: hypothetical protein ACRDZY_01880 [Acidimicrobiales bacterium]
MGAPHDHALAAAHLADLGREAGSLSQSRQARRARQARREEVRRASRAGGARRRTRAASWPAAELRTRIGWLMVGAGLRLVLRRPPPAPSISATAR